MMNLWKFTQTRGLEPEHDPLLQGVDREDLNTWLERIGFIEIVIQCGEAFNSALAVYQHHTTKNRYLAEMRTQGMLTYILLPSFPDCLEFLRRYVPLMTQFCQLELFQHIVTPDPDEDALAAGLGMLADQLQERESWQPVNDDSIPLA